MKKNEAIGVVGLDLSLTSTGFAAIRQNEKGEESEFCYAHASSPADGPIEQRIRNILQSLAKTINEGDFIFVEDYAYGKNMPGAQARAELVGVIKFFFREKYKRRIVPVSPGTIKKWATGKGNAKKDDMKLACYKKFGIEFGSSDEADAYALADFGYHAVVLGNSRRKLTKDESQQLAKFRDSMKKNGFLDEWKEVK